ncbi:MAG TPA: hypothetical protein VGB18_06720 [Candidatus Thermoplasmatota archaeon]
MAIMLFSGAFFYLTQASVEREADTSVAQSSNVQARAAALADIIVSSGVGWYGGAPCVETSGTKTVDSSSFDPDGLSATVAGEVQGRFGLGEELCLRGPNDSRSRNNLSYSKVMSLYKASNDANPSNDRVDYEEARKSLGLAEGEDFHIRAWPIMASVHQILGSGYQDPLMHPLYIGDYDDVTSTTTTEEIEWTSSVVDSSSHVTIGLTIKNTGTEAAIFGSLFDIPLDKGSVGFTLHTPLLASEDEYMVEFTIRKSSDWAWDDPTEKWITFEIQDRDGEVGDGVIDLSSVDMTYLTEKTNVFVEASEMYWVKSGPSVATKLSYMAFEGDGTKKKVSDWKLLTTDPLGVPSTTTLTSNVFAGTATVTALLDGCYKAEVKTLLLTATWNWDCINVVSSDDEVHRWTTSVTHGIAPNPAVAIEAGFIEVLVRDFDNGVFRADYSTLAVPYVAGGDIFPDLKSVMDNDLVDALTDANGDPTYDYTLIVVGSDVDQNAMTSHSAKQTIADWVLGGGTLIVFGSEAQNVQWLRPLFDAGIETANGPIQTPDEGHPVLQVPNQLDYAGYENTNQWAFNNDGGDAFTHVVQTGDGSVLAVGNAGAFGDGRVVLTAWRPYDLQPNMSELCPTPLTSPSDCEALFVLHNVLTLSYTHLFIDYGPPLPTDGNVGSQLRVVSVYHPELRELVPMQLQIFVFE